jgi:drug/metabolite transporter (DMT)-like permease
MLFGCLFILLYLLITGQFSQLNHLNINQLSWVWLSGIILTGYVLTWYSGLRYIKVSVACCLLALGAPITTLLTLFQGKSIALPQFFGLFLLFIGVLFIILFSRIRGEYEEL